MGCDIHMFIEYKCGNGLPWQADDHHVATWEGRCRDNNPHTPDEWCSYCVASHVHNTEQWRCDYGYLDFGQVNITCRNYNLFAQLASVRGLGPREPRGLPGDVSPVIRAAAEAWGSDGHSHSYMSAEELKQVLLEEMQWKPCDPKFNDAFVRPWSISDIDNRPPYWTPILRYCDKLKEEKSIDKQILGQDVSSEVQIRLVFWFDN